MKTGKSNLSSNRIISLTVYENFTLLAKDVDFKGVVNFDGTVRVDGRVEGEINTTGTLIVGEHAVIKGIVSAGVLMNSGKINGTITAAEKIQILKPASLSATSEPR